ncbi:MAG TPA: XRE family transcriptional regulator [bacterium]|nr:XRE family transcriptional regulator [bacterium]
MKETIRNYCITHGISPKDFAKKAGISLSILSRFQSDHLGCSISHIKKLDAALEMD